MNKLEKLEAENKELRESRDWWKKRWNECMEVNRNSVLRIAVLKELVHGNKTGT